MSAVYTIAAYPKEVPLRDGTPVTIRPLEKGDRDLLDFFLGIPEEERFFLKDDVTSPAVIGKWLEELDYNRVLPLLALHDGRIVAEAALVRRRGGARSHLAELRVVVAPDFRGRGLGTLLIRELCDIANDAELNGVLFEVVEDLEKEAIETAEWLGFIRVGTIVGGARDQQGELHDLALYVMPLGKWYEWSKY
jgi:GNAT superfamily N-acetyltransferase